MINSACGLRGGHTTSFPQWFRYQYFFDTKHFLAKIWRLSPKWPAKIDKWNIYKGHGDTIMAHQPINAHSIISKRKCWNSRHDEMALCCSDYGDSAGLTRFIRQLRFGFAIFDEPFRRESPHHAALRTSKNVEALSWHSILTRNDGVPASYDRYFILGMPPLAFTCDAKVGRCHAA